MGRAEEAFSQAGAIIHIKDAYHTCALKAFCESRQEGRAGGKAACGEGTVRFSKEERQIDPNSSPLRI